MFEMGDRHCRPGHLVECQMFVREYGSTCPGPPLLFIHGLGESGLCFESFLQEPGLGHLRCLVPDLPGYGRSPWPRRPLGFEAMVDHLAAWLRWRGEDRLVVVGHSMGGVLALLLAERHPDLVLSLVDIEGNISSADCSFSKRAADQELEGFLAGGFALFRGDMARDGETDPGSAGYAVSLRLADPVSYYQHSVELVERSVAEDLAPRLAALEVPRCYIAGVGSAVRSGLSQRSHELLARAGVPASRVDPAGHWPFIDRPDAVVALLLDHLGEDPGAR
jgi:pimeloyl-ACP methyl ester carboxylesterase